MLGIWSRKGNFYKTAETAYQWVEYRLVIFYLPEILTRDKFEISFRFESEYYDKCIELSHFADRLPVFHTKADYLAGVSVNP